MEWNDLSEGRQMAAETALAVMGRTGMAVGREIEGELIRLNVGPGLAKRAVNDLEAFGLVIKAAPKLYRSMKLTLVRLSEYGREFYSQWQRVEAAKSEWGRLIEEHDGERNERHTLGVLALAWQARRRGHQVKLLPGRMRGYTQVHTWVEPDLKISFPGLHDAWTPVEFETRPRGKMDKWERWSRNNGFGVCTFTERQKESMTRELERAGVRKRAWMMSLEGLMKDPEAKIFNYGQR